MEEVLKLAVALGKREETEELSLLCAAAVEELTGLLRDGVSPEDCGGAFALAAAWMALAGTQVSGDDVESFTAGQVSICRGESSARQKALRLQAIQVMRPWLRDEGFVFRGVKG